MVFRTVGGVLLALLGLVACGRSPICPPGTTQACLCAGALHGAQTCAEDGARWDACACTPQQPSTASTGATGPSPAAGSTPRPPERASAQACPASVHDVDWMNRDYIFLASEPSVRIRRGVKQIAPDDSAPLGITYTVRGPIYGDVSGDGVDEAVVTMAFLDGGNGVPVWLDVFTVRDCQVVSLGKVPEAREDSDFNDLQNVRIVGGRIVVDRRVWLGTDPHCCPTQFGSEQWKVENGQVVEDVAARTVRPLRPGE